MIKKTLVLLCGALAFASCLKENSPYESQQFIEAVDTQGIEIFMSTHKVVEGENGPELAKTTADDPENLWNTRRTADITEATTYDELVGHAFADTSRVGVIDDKGDTILAKTGVWVYVNQRGQSLERPVDSCAVLVQYTGTLLDDQQFTINPASVIYLYTESITGFRRGMKYFEPGHLKWVTITPEPDEDGNQAPPYEVQQWADGGQGWIIMPSRVGYGNTLSGEIPPNSVLVFNVTLLSISKYPVVEEGDASDKLLLNRGDAPSVWMNTPPAVKTVHRAPAK